MQPTLHDRDYMIVNKFSYRFTEADRFDIVVFHAEEQKDYIKRIIGLPGEHIAYKNDELYVNGEAVKEPFLESEKEAIAPNVLTTDFTLEEQPGGYSVIPKGYVFVLGDNRLDSKDSRYLGLISDEEIVGKTSLTYWPFDRFSFSRK